ncbi:acetyl-CoA C-acetyltransferase [Alicycliphilus denitrificans]|uniref:Acetyl-CoA acetyltransferase n=2 Tax=Alicycliphilus denitrificans TaxID=179636 RepID=F4GDL2_ALIDK|nr:acetyl-CoA C-acetyltransferase [Alicycliphilus denitrificans]ADU97953.1 acetyl-CoA acetyltransferase [Alicycliphilus denitrificans BC]AEB82595.1 acetyl-CoA acetyltransferase [Alicycliphilus denitrificans K601]QKD42287.1 acetyl-CoA C-acetyltransferase [Alicycliphilus denitrificans]GAO25889.1 acetyl-CoA acetyltransferase [Alicycliphilus sp. B1]
MRRAAIVTPVRTPVGTFGGSLRPVPVEELAATTVRAVVQKSGIDPARIDDVVMAQSYANSEVPCVGRWAALQAGLPVEVPGMQLDRRCGGGLQAIVTASMMVQSGAADVVIAGGVESMSNIEYYSTDMRWGARSGNVRFYDRLDRGRERSQPVERFGKISGMIETAENLARDYSITRDEADAYALRSHQRAAAAWAAGRFADEVVPVQVPQRKGDPVTFARDEGFRADVTTESLAKLRVLMPNGTVTAGNASQQNDASAACLIVAEDKLAELGLTPMATLVGWAAAGCEPSHMGIGPVPAVKKLLARLSLKIDDMDLVELNEAFACQVLAVLKGWGWQDQGAIEHKLNVNGSGISLGHPIGATGVRILATLLHELQRRKGRYGLETMCIGGGQGIAAVFERV